jgi:hypothetical protein
LARSLQAGWPIIDGVALLQRSSHGRSLRQGVEYLIPFATGERSFPYEQITGFRACALHPVLRQAAAGWREPRYRDLARQIGGGTQRLELTRP